MRLDLITAESKISELEAAKAALTEQKSLLEKKVEELSELLKQSKDKFIQHEKVFDIGDGGMVKRITQALTGEETKS